MLTGMVWIVSNLTVIYTCFIVYSAKDVRIQPVIVHVMVMRKQLESGHLHLIEEQVQFINEKRVEQVDVLVCISNFQLQKSCYMQILNISVTLELNLIHSGADNSYGCEWQGVQENNCYG